MDDLLVNHCENEYKSTKAVVLRKGVVDEVNIIPFKTSKVPFASHNTTASFAKQDLDRTFRYCTLVLVPSELNCDTLVYFKPVPTDCDVIINMTDLGEDTNEESVQEVKRHKCTICNYSTFQKGNLKVHHLTHSGERKFECDLCSYKATQKSSLKTHVLIKHDNPTKLKCSQCEYKTALKGNLKKHFLKHSGEKRFQCPECNFRATQKSTVTTHLRLVHFASAKELLKCTYCDYKTVLKGNLKVHELRHIEKLKNL